MPIARDWITSIGISPSKLLIPLSNSSILGGQPTFIGSASNLIAKGLSVENVTVAGLDARNPALQFWGRACSGIANLIAALPPCRRSASRSRMGNATATLAGCLSGQYDGLRYGRLSLRGFPRMGIGLTVSLAIQCSLICPLAFPFRPSP